MADTQTNILITARDEASGVFAKVGGGLDGMAGKMLAVGAAVGAVAGIAAGARWLTDITSQSIQAADRLGELSQQTGVAGSVLSQYSLVAKQSGVDVEGLAAGLNKLNIKVDDAANGGKEASAAFARIGVAVKDAGGEVRSTDDIMLDVAESFSNMEDGAAKTAIAVDLFGKAGANMIPFLNQGRDGLKEAAEVADKLGIKLKDSTIKAADQTSDAFALVGSMASGLGNKIMAEVLPTVLDLTEKFKKFVIETGALDVAAKIVAGSFKALVTAGQIVGGVFELIVNSVSTTGKALSLIAQGEFKAAFKAVETGVEKAGDIVASTGKSIVSTWTRTVDDVVKADDKNNRKKGEVADAHKKLKTEVDKAAKAFEDYIRASQEKLRVAEDELSAGRKLTDIEKERNEFLSKLDAGVIKATESEKAAALALFDKREQTALLLKADEDYRKGIDDTRKALDSRLATEEKAGDVLRQAIDRQQEENEKIGKTKDQLAALEINKLRDVQATKLRRIEILDTIPGMEAEIEALQDQVGLYDDLIARKEEGRVAAAMKDAADEAQKAAEDSRKAWQKTSESIESSLTDALMRGFESGKGFLQNLVSTAKNLFNTLILRPTIQYGVQTAAGGVTSLLGLPGATNAAGGGAGAGSGGFGDLLSSAGSLFGAGGLGGSLMAGAGWLTGATTLTGSLTAAGSLIGTGSLGGIGAGIGMGLGALGPIALGAMAVMSLLGDGGGPKTGGSFDTIGLSDRLFTPNNADSTASTFGTGVLESISQMATALGGSSGKLGLAFGFDQDPEGDAASRISSILRDAQGNTLFESVARNVGRDDKQFDAELGNEAARLLLEGLQASDLPAQIAEYLAGYDATRLGASDIGAILAGAQDLVPKAEKSLLDRAMEDPGTYAAVSTEVRELVTINTDAYAIHREALDVAKAHRDLGRAQVDRLDAQIAQMGAGLIELRDRLIEIAGSTMRTAESVRQAAQAPVPV